MKCPFKFNNSTSFMGGVCDNDCFCRLSVFFIEKDGTRKIIGHTCAFAAIGSARDLPDNIYIMGTLEPIPYGSDRDQRED